MFSEMGVNVLETEDASEHEEQREEPEEQTGGELVEVEHAVPAKSDAKEPTEGTNDPVRIYLREMGSVDLLSRAGEIAANLVLDSYNLLGDWGKVNEWARKFYASDKLAVGQFRADLAKLIEQSSFKLINQLEAKKEFVKAGDAYLAFVTDWPKSELADKALFNAAIDYFNGKALNRAIEVRKQLIQKYPKSQYVPQTTYALAEGYEAIEHGNQRLR
jgi:TolA-binding protein